MKQDQRKYHTTYLSRFGEKQGRVMLLGMNPGPWGMAQTGVPFGEIESVRSWIGIETPVAKPEHEHPKRPVDGFACQRSEVSGRRVWAWAQERFGTAEAFFEDFYVANYCPLSFMEESGKNRTPDKLPKEEQHSLYAICDQYLASLVDLLEPRHIVGIGAFAENQAKKALPNTHIPIGRILHPSPASPIANRGWAPQAEAQLIAMNLL